MEDTARQIQQDFSSTNVAVMANRAVKLSDVMNQNTNTFDSRSPKKVAAWVKYMMHLDHFQRCLKNNGYMAGKWQRWAPYQVCPQDVCTIKAHRDHDRTIALAWMSGMPPTADKLDRLSCDDDPVYILGDTMMIRYIF